MPCPRGGTWSGNRATQCPCLSALNSRLTPTSVVGAVSSPGRCRAPSTNARSHAWRGGRNSTVTGWPACPYVSANARAASSKLPMCGVKKRTPWAAARACSMCCVPAHWTATGFPIHRRGSSATNLPAAPTAACQALGETPAKAALPKNRRRYSPENKNMHQPRTQPMPCSSHKGSTDSNLKIWAMARIKFGRR